MGHQKQGRHESEVSHGCENNKQAHEEEGWKKPPHTLISWIKENKTKRRKKSSQCQSKRSALILDQENCCAS